MVIGKGSVVIGEEHWRSSQPNILCILFMFIFTLLSFKDLSTLV